MPSALAKAISADQEVACSPTLSPYSLFAYYRAGRPTDIQSQIANLVEAKWTKSRDGLMLARTTEQDRKLREQDKGRLKDLFHATIRRHFGDALAREMSEQDVARACAILKATVESALGAGAINGAALKGIKANLPARRFLRVILEGADPEWLLQAEREGRIVLSTRPTALQTGLAYDESKLTAYKRELNLYRKHGSDIPSSLTLAGGGRFDLPQLRFLKSELVPSVIVMCLAKAATPEQPGLQVELIVCDAEGHILDGDSLFMPLDESADVESIYGESKLALSPSCLIAMRRAAGIGGARVAFASSSDPLRLYVEEVLAAFARALDVDMLACLPDDSLQVASSLARLKEITTGAVVKALYSAGVEVSTHDRVVCVRPRIWQLSGLRYSDRRSWRWLCNRVTGDVATVSETGEFLVKNPCWQLDSPISFAFFGKGGQRFSLQVASGPSWARFSSVFEARSDAEPSGSCTGEELSVAEQRSLLSALKSDKFRSAVPGLSLPQVEPTVALAGSLDQLYLKWRRSRADLLSIRLRDGTLSPPLSAKEIAGPQSQAEGQVDANLQLWRESFLRETYSELVPVASSKIVFDIQVATVASAVVSLRDDIKGQPCRRAIDLPEPLRSLFGIGKPAPASKCWAE